MTRLRTAVDAVRLQALLSRLDPRAAERRCAVEGCVHREGAPHEAEPPRRPRPIIQAA